MKDANTIIEESVSQREEVYSHLRAAADFFHEHEGTFFERGEAIAQLSDELSIEQDIAGQVIAELVGDIVDPVVLSAVNGEKYVGVVEFEEFDGAYGYVDYHDVRGPDKRVVCQQCVNEANLDTQVAHATAGDPSGTVSSGADYDELLDIVHEHYENSHDVVPEDVATGATLASGTTIGGNESWHAGNDGSGSGLDADNIRGASPAAVATSGSHNDLLNIGSSDHHSRYSDSEASNAAPVQSVNGSTGDVTVEGVPSGVISMWSGSTSNVPSGWTLCDGTDGTPDLRDRFVVGAGNQYTVDETGGAESVQLTVDEMPSHNHTVARSSNSGQPGDDDDGQAVTDDRSPFTDSTGSTGNDQAHENRPPYYALAYIMKL
jgi:microcystin-dependent protein